MAYILKPSISLQKALSMKNKLFSSYQLGAIELKNRVVMAPMTRSRATSDNIPTDIMATYYAQRAGAGLIITEGVSPSPDGTGYPRIPGIYNQAQIDGWRKIADAVHQKEGKIFMQLMHTGRIGHPLVLAAGAQVVAPSAVAAKGDVYTDQQGMQLLPTPKAMTPEELQKAKQEFVQAATNAVKAGLDGIELHSANGYLLEQFLNPHTNQRTDEYGGSVENRCRFLIEVATQIVASIGKEKVGVRFSPYGLFNDMPLYGEIDQTYNYLAKELQRIGLVYIHILDHAAIGAKQVPDALLQSIRRQYKGSLILCGGFDAEIAEDTLQQGKADLIAFGRAFIGNPDLVERLKKEAPLTMSNHALYYTPGPKGYTDYPTLNEEFATVEH